MADRIERARFLCTRDNPYTLLVTTRTDHPDAVCTYDGGMAQEYERYECPHCKTRFTVEIAQ